MGGIVDYRVYYAGGILQIYGSNRWFDRNHEFQSFDGSEALIVPPLPPLIRVYERYAVEFYRERGREGAKYFLRSN